MNKNLDSKFYNPKIQILYSWFYNLKYKRYILDSTIWKSNFVFQILQFVIRFFYFKLYNLKYKCIPNYVIHNTIFYNKTINVRGYYRDDIECESYCDRGDTTEKKKRDVQWKNENKRINYYSASSREVRKMTWMTTFSCTSMISSGTSIKF